MFALGHRITILVIGFFRYSSDSILNQFGMYVNGYSLITLPVSQSLVQGSKLCVSYRMETVYKILARLKTLNQEQ